MGDALDTVVMKKLMARLGPQYNDLKVWLNRDYGDETQRQIQQYQHKVDEIRKWAKGLEDKAVRRAYLGWLDDYYQRGLDDARRELATREMLIGHEKYNRERQQERENVAAYQERFTVPDPPA